MYIMKDSKYRVISYNKLVRDKIPTIIRDNGGNAEITVIEDDGDFHIALVLHQGLFDD